MPRVFSARYQVFLRNLFVEAAIQSQKGLPSFSKFALEQLRTRLQCYVGRGRGQDRKAGPILSLHEPPLIIWFQMVDFFDAPSLLDFGGS